MDTVIELTPDGEQRALSIKGKGPKYHMMTELYENGGRMVAEELEGEMGLEPEQVEKVAKALESKGFVRIFR